MAEIAVTTTTTVTSADAYNHDDVDHGDSVTIARVS